MDNRVVATRLVLRELGFGGAVDSIEHRVEAQKLVFLAQQLGVGLGYSYNWYVKGPYSPSLTKSYYSAEWALGEESLAKFKLTEATEQAVQKILTAKGACPPALSAWRWLELLASVAYLKKVSCLTDEKAKERIAAQKPHLVENFENSVDALRHVGII